jgi:NAD(P)H-dependent FMN reductase
MQRVGVLSASLRAGSLTPQLLRVPGSELAASGYVEDGAGYIAGFFGEEPEDRVGYFFR